MKKRCNVPFTVPLWILLLMLVGVLPSCICLHQNDLWRNGDVMLGGLFPIHLTYTDNKCIRLRPEALVLSEAMSLAVEEINNSQDILPNVTIGYVIRDTCGSEQIAIKSAADFSFTNSLMFESRYKQAVNDCRPYVMDSNYTSLSPIMSVIGGEDSRVSKNVASVLQLNDIPQISYGASSAELSNSQFSTFFRTVPSDNFQSHAMVDIIMHYEWSCVALIGTDDVYGRSGVNTFVEAGKASNLCIASMDLFPVHDYQEKIKEIIIKLKGMVHVDIIVLYSLSAQAVNIFDEALEQGMTGKTWIASDGWARSPLVRQSRYIPIIQGTIGLEFRDVKHELLEDHLLNITSSTHKGLWWSQFWSELFNCSTGHVKSEKTCNGSERISRELYQNKLHGPLIAYVRDAVYASAHALHTLLICNSTKSCKMKLSNLTTEMVVTSLRSLSFQGLTGYLDFSKGEVQAQYDVLNIQLHGKELNAVNVGTWNVTSIYLNDNQIQWSNGKIPRSTCGDVCQPGTFKSSTIQCIWACVPCSGDTITSIPGSIKCDKCKEGYIANANHTECVEVPPDYISPSHPWGIALMTLTVLCLTATMTVIGIFVYNHNTPIVTETGRLLNFALLFEILFSYIFNILLLQKPSDSTCVFLGVYFYLVYTSAVLTFILKVYNIRRIMDSPRKLSIRLNSMTQPCSAPGKKAKPMWMYYVASLAASMLSVILAVVWVAIDGVYCGKVIISRAQVYYSCKSMNSPIGLFLRILNVLYLAILALIGTVYAYRTKNIPQLQKFREAKHLAYSMTVFLVTLYTFYPGWTLIQGPVLQVFACSTNLIAASSVIICAFGPKIQLIFREPLKNATTHVRPISGSVTDVALGMGVTLLTTARGRSVTVLSSSQSTPPSIRMSTIHSCA
ncbi:predicted protein [Nematostella vectensis]|uniref:G-protein coupled receptors family 3 profile domain-containing protein n=1 Tax=Nematostella vectensis TaxID=45351 RepID=A7RX43_NEMVE|nr:predicted protein [Nematostella vectensis]|eukprot:XP_001636028.1 predicted protein [Nematostella vectensis]